MGSPLIVLYTRAGCHLCEEAKATLEQFGLRFEEVDIDLDPELREKYDLCVPVVTFDGKVRFRGRVDSRLLARLLAAL